MVLAAASFSSQRSPACQGKQQVATRRRLYLVSVALIALTLIAYFYLMLCAPFDDERTQTLEVFNEVVVEEVVVDDLRTRKP